MAQSDPRFNGTWAGTVSWFTGKWSDAGKCLLVIKPGDQEGKTKVFLSYFEMKEDAFNEARLYDGEFISGDNGPQLKFKFDGRLKKAPANLIAGDFILEFDKSGNGLSGYFTNYAVKRSEVLLENWRLLKVEDSYGAELVKLLTPSTPVAVAPTITPVSGDTVKAKDALPAQQIPATNQAEPAIANNDGNATATTTEAQPSGKGTISGKLFYPSDQIPADFAVYAVSMQTGQVHQAKKQDVRPDKRTYKMELPAGNYQVYAMVGFLKGQKAYHTPNVKSNFTDTSHQRIIITVMPGSSQSDIHMADWWDNSISATPEPAGPTLVKGYSPENADPSRKFVGGKTGDELGRVLVNALKNNDSTTWLRCLAPSVKITSEVRDDFGKLRNRLASFGLSDWSKVSFSRVTYIEDKGQLTAFKIEFNYGTDFIGAFGYFTGAGLYNGKYLLNYSIGPGTGNMIRYTRR
ncbi:hypothetical protein [Pseudobacter ginsenosidimutans]|nr:hypothetical protein [Pseudobacter ginsenosidimutans]